MKIAIAVLVLCLCSQALAWEEDLDRALSMEPGAERDALVKKIAEAQPECGAMAARIVAGKRPDATKGTFLRRRTCTDGVERPWVLDVPESYDPGQPTPVFVWLHGLVTRPEIMSDAADYAERMAFTKMARARGWITVIPMGQNGSTWFDPVGMENVREILRTVKRERNVDDDRVWMGGFSDGGSACFSYAMLEPSDYGAFLALNGHMGVASEYGKLETYAPNYANSPVYVMTSDRDSLYATEKMRPSIEMSIAAGARFLYRQFYGTHDFRHVVPEVDNLAQYLERHPRSPLPGRIVWETADPEAFGRCHWFAIDAVTGGPRADWHQDHNALVDEDRVTIGFNHAQHDGEGVKVADVVADTYAEKVGLKAGDLITHMNGQPVKDLDGLSAEKRKVERGDQVVLVVTRDGKEVTLSGNLPPVQRYWIFNHRKRSALAQATFSANRITVRASRVGAIRILVHPAMVNLNDPLVITVNGQKLYEDYVEPDPGFLLRNHLAERDRKLLYVAEVKVLVPMR